MQQEIKPRKTSVKIARIVLRTVLFILLFVLFIFILLLTPPVQKFLTAKVQHYLENKLHTKVLIGRISFGLSGKVGLNNVYIEDKTRDTLVSGGSIRGHVNFLRLLSNEVRVKDLEFQNITAKVKRVLPDTVFNFQFIVNAFASEQTKKPDTAKTPPMKLSINDVALENVNITYTDVISGSDLFAHIGNFTATIDTLDPYTQHFAIPSFILRNSSARVKQMKPLVEPKPLEQHVQEAEQPSPMHLSLGIIDLSRITVDYGNDVSAVYATANIGGLRTQQRLLDLQTNQIHLDELALNKSKIAVRFGKKEQAKVVKQEVKKEVQAQKQAGWDVQISRFALNDNAIEFNDDNKPALAHGMDYAHLDATHITLQADNIVMTPDSVSMHVSKGSMREKSGFQLEQLSGDVLYANNQSYVRNLYVKTPGSELKRGAVLHYASLEALSKHPEKTNVQIELVKSHIQVKDILVFAPQLRSNPALRNPDDVWQVNIIGSGNMDQFNFESLQFSGLSNTQIDAHGSLTGLSDPKRIGGDFVINRFHSNQTDIALFTGQSLSNQQVSLPRDFTVSGRINGNSGALNAKLNVSTSDGFIAVNGRFSGLTNPEATTYNGVITTTNLQIGKILRQQDMIGSLTARASVNGKGLTPNSINTKFSVNIASFGYNKYQYRNVNLSGSLRKTVYDVKADIKDPNVDADFIATGNFSAHPAFKINGMVDSIKTLPLHLTTEPLVFRGKIDGTASNFDADNPDANILITQALFVSSGNRVAMDTIQLLSGRSDTGNYIKLTSSIVTGSITGQYRLADLGNIIQQTIQPYFTVAPASQLANVKPYNFRFAADVVYNPILSVFIPGLTDMETLHSTGTFSNNGGMTAQLTTPHVIYQGNDISKLNVTANTTANGLNVNGNIAHLKSGNSFDVYNVRLNATALHNNIDFSLGTDDQNSKQKYFIAGLVTQPSTGTYAIKLKPDSLMLNYQKWTVTPDNSITISPTAIAANNFVLQNGDQRLSISSAQGQGQQPVVVNFSNFRLATITGFVKADSILADGLINGNVTLNNLTQQPSFTSDLTINNFTMRSDTVGDVALHVTTAGSNRYNTNVTITGRGNDVALTGWFAMAGSDVDLNLDLNVRALQLHTLEGALASAIKNASGTVNGSVAIRGSVNNPSVQGTLNFDKASFALTPLGSQFYLDNQKLSVTQDGFVFNNFTIKDSSNNSLSLNGAIITNNFVNYEFNLKVAARNFQLLNSTKKDNPLYYGRVNVSTDMSITGTEVKPAVDGKVTVNDGTALTVVVPQPEPGVQSREGIVEFVDMSNPASDTLFKKYDSLNKASVLGMDIALNIEVKKEAIFNIIVDEANGDFLNVQGDALLTTGIDPSGKITLVGTYTLDKGAYQLSFNLLQRKFDIAKGSTITWTGEPTTAQLNVSAIYIANTSPIDLVQDQIASSPVAIRNTYKQKLPFEVHLNLTGELMKPNVAFDIVLPEDKNYGVSNDIVTTTQYKLAQLRQDQGETNKQVFSLLLMNRFVGENPFAGSGGGGGFNVSTYARQSASKLLTEQLNQLAAGLIGGVDINFNVTSTEDYTTGSLRNRTDLDMAVSKKLLNDRLKISVGSNFELEGPQNANQHSNNLAGNLAMDYQLSKDGRYFIRFFRKNDYEGVVDGYVVENGLTFMIIVDYNHFKEILQRRKQRVPGSEGTQNSTAK
jgi:translocation and assembly module TamB